MKRLFVVLVGLPASGKSTYRTAMAKAYQALGIPLTQISSDDYIEAEAAKAGKTYSEAFAEFAEGGRRHCNTQLALGAAFNQNIVWDQTNLTVKKRKSIITRLSPKHYTFVAAYSEVADDVLAARLAARPGKEITERVIADMRASYVRPTLEEGFDQIFDINAVGSDVESWEQLTQRVRDTFDLGHRVGAALATRP